MKILCLNINESVWKHWLTVAPSDKSLVRVLSMDELKRLLDESKPDNVEYCFIYLDHEHFHQMIESAITLRREYPSLKIITFPNKPSQTAGLRLLSQGINGQCSPYIGKKQLETVLSVVAMGEIWVGKSFIDQLITANSMDINIDDLASQESFELLSAKEREVAVYISKGLSNKQIASEMSISDRTVKSHMTNIFKKTNIKDRLGLSILVQKVHTVH